MGKKHLIFTIGFGLASLFSFYSHFSKPPRTYEIDLLKGASAYLLQYEDQNQEEALRYAENTLEIVAKSRNIQIPEVSDLEKELSQINEEIKTSGESSVDKPALKSVGKEIEKTASKYGREGLSLLIGIFCGVYSISEFVKYLTGGEVRRYGIKY